MTEFNPEFDPFSSPDLQELEASLEVVKSIELGLAWQAESRPNPLEGVTKGVPQGHIAFMGGFEL